MTKPEKVTKSFYLYGPCERYLDETYEMDQRDYAGRGKAFEAWCDEKGYRDYDDNGVPRRYSQELFYDYMAEVHSDVVKRPDHLDFWHWVMDKYGVFGSRFIVLKHSDIGEIEEEWVRYIYSLWILEFGDDEGNVELWVEV